GAGPRALAAGAADARALPRRVRRRTAEALAAQPLATVPRLPRGQGRLLLHRVGHPELLRAGLAASLLSHGRRLCRVVPRAAGDDPVGAVRAGTRSPLRTVHGALRVRTDGDRGHRELTARVAARHACDG